MQTAARILAFKELANLLAELSQDQRWSEQWHHVGAALCWAGGCNCEESKKFEEDMIRMGAQVGTLEGVEIRDIHGRKIDLAIGLAVGVPDEAVKRAEARTDEANRIDAGSE